MPRRGPPVPCQSGTKLKAAFTIHRPTRYDGAVIVIPVLAAAAVSVAQAPPLSAVAAKVEARATVRIVSGVQLHFDGDGRRDGLVRRDTVIRSAGAVQPAILIEFE